MADAARRRPWPAVPHGLWLPLAWAAGWLLLVDGGVLRHPLLVPLHRILAAPLVDPDGRQLWAATAWSLLRVAAGFSLGAVLGVAGGLAIGLLRPAQACVAPTLHALRQVALFAWIPLLTAWFGNGEGAKLVFIALSTFFPVLLNTEQGVRGIAPAYREVAAMARLRPLRRLTRLVLPAALPSILIGIELGLLTAWIGTVGAEYALGTGRGIGAFLAAARDLFRMDLVLLGVLVLAGVGYLFSRLSGLLFDRLIVWRTR